MEASVGLDLDKSDNKVHTLLILEIFNHEGRISSFPFE